jgi:glycosyltransferase involved in cell wall biosynthesis
MTHTLSNPTVSVIIPVHNGGDNFRRCLLSVKELKPSPEEVIVVADGDPDGSWEVAEGFDLQVLRRPSPGGPAQARNLGANNAKGDILLFIDADVTVPYDTIEKVVTSFQIYPDLDALIGSYDDEPFETNFLSQYKNLLHHFVHQTSNREASTFWGACGAIRREVFFKMGGFDKRYRRPSIEDIDLGYRLKKAGYKIYLLKQIQVKHLKHWGIISLLRADFFFRALPWTNLILNEGRFLDDLNIKFTSRISVLAVFLLALTFIGSMFSSWLLAPSVFLMVLLFGLNWDLYRFFLNKRGLNFAVKTIPWHWFYFLYSGLAFSIGFAKYLLKRLSFEK